MGENVAMVRVEAVRRKAETRGLKIPRPPGHEGSSPSSGTIKFPCKVWWLLEALIGPALDLPLTPGARPRNLVSDSAGGGSGGFQHRR